LSIDSAIVIIDESQNISFDIFKTIITRIGEDCKYIFLGDTEQVDMKKKDKSCLQTVINIFKDTELIKTLEFGDDDCVRNPKIPKVLEILRENNL
jgi:phosphate starvation-inducible protein PhoH